MDSYTTGGQVHDEIERIFRILLPQNGLEVREEQISLCHFILDSLIKNKTALCDAGVGIGKTYAYLVACVLLREYRPQIGRPLSMPVVISTSTVALQEAMIGEYIPFLSRVLLENQMIQKPIRAIIRKGKERFVCDARLAQRLESVLGKAKNPAQREALHSLLRRFDLDSIIGLSNFDRRQICVPKVCPKDCRSRPFCRYNRYLKEARSPEIFIQICNHNYLLADAAHRVKGILPLLNDYRALIIDEAHKLPDAARQMYGSSLSPEGLCEICRLLECVKLLHVAQRLREKFRALLSAMCRGELLEAVPRTAFVLTAEREAALREALALLRQVSRQLAPHIPRWLLQRLEDAERVLNLFYTMDRHYILYIQYDRTGNPCLCTASRETPSQLNQALWQQGIPAILTSGTLMAGRDFKRTKQLMGLIRTEEFRADSPFNYEENCLLFIPAKLSKAPLGGEREIMSLSSHIYRLVEATCGHTLALFTSYSVMGAVYNRLKNALPYPLMGAWRHSPDVIHQFKQSANAALFAAGACWEGMDFPGDMVSSLIITRLPFPSPDPLREAEREQYPSLQDYIKAVIVPDMQKQLRQGFGRAIRTETDTCVISILDYRAAPGQRYHQAVLEALPEMQMTQDIEAVKQFIREKKTAEYFEG